MGVLLGPLPCASPAAQSKIQPPPRCPDSSLFLQTSLKVLINPMWVGATLGLLLGWLQRFRKHGAGTVPGHCGVMLYPTGRQRLFSGVLSGLELLGWALRWHRGQGAQAAAKWEPGSSGERRIAAEAIWEGKGSCELCLWEAGAGRACLLAGGACLERRGSTSPSPLCNRLQCIPN